MRHVVARPLAGLAALALAGFVAAPGPAHADDADCSSVSTTTQPVPSTDAESAPLAALGLPTTLADGAPATGAGVTVAVVDSGVLGPIPVSARQVVAGGDPYFHGTAAAGLIAGPPRPGNKPVGIAPGATIVDVQVYAASQNAPAKPTSGAVAAGLQWLAGNKPDIAVVPLQVPDSPALKQAVAALVGEGVIVVAPAGDRADSDGTGDASPSPYTGTEDVATKVFPAGYPGVVVVGDADGPDPSHVMMANSRTMVSAPTSGAVSYGVDSGTCVVEPSSAFAAAEVAGVLALERQQFPHDPADALVQRLMDTASGRPDVMTRFTGAGVVQPHEALTRLVGSATKPLPPDLHASVPKQRPDLLQGTRRSAVWWGLGAGGLLIIALLLRPLAARRGR